MRILPRHAAALFLGLVLGFVSPWLNAADGLPSIRTSPGKPVMVKELDADADGRAGHRPAAKTAGAEDPMDKLRERLAQKLGVQASEQDATPGVLRVVSHPAVPSGAAAAAMAPGAAPEPGIRWSDPQHGAVKAATPRAALPKPAARPEHWAYEGNGGPEHWAEIKPEFAACSNGKRQSPIDIRDGISVDLDPVQFDYKPSNFRVIDNGHTVQVNVTPGNTIEVMGRRYELQQFHFHRPSEERINGRQFDMVVHLVHKDLDGHLAVLAVLLDRGSVQPVVQMVWNNLPLEKGDEVAARSTLDLNDLLPAQRGYFTYMGSLTTPPCSEGVLWMVMKNPVAVSADQIGIFARLYPMNARPIQSASGRLIKGSN